MNPDIFTRYSELDPAVSPEAMPDWKLVGPVLLETLEGRTTHMQVRETETRIRERQPRFKGALAGAAAFAAVLAIAAVALVLTRNADEVAGDAGLIEVAQEFTRSVSDGETDLSGYLSPDATYTRVGTIPITGDLAGYWSGLGTDLVLESCEQSGDRLVSCEGIHANAIHRAMRRELSATWLFLFEDDRISSVLEDVDSESLLSGGAYPIEDYIAWLNARHPEYLDEVEFLDPDRRNQRFDTATTAELLPEAFLVLDADNARILRRHVDEYDAELTATGGIPENWSPDRWSGG